MFGDKHIASVIMYVIGSAINPKSHDLHGKIASQNC